MARSGARPIASFPTTPCLQRRNATGPKSVRAGDWRVRTETYSAMRASKTHWHVTGRLEAYEGDKLIFSRDWDKKIIRKLV